MLMLPLSPVVPPLYTSLRVRSRAFCWYARLREGEAKLETGTDARETLLDELDRVTHRIAAPLSYASSSTRCATTSMRRASACWRSGHADGGDD